MVLSCLNILHILWINAAAISKCSTLQFSTAALLHLPLVGGKGGSINKFPTWHIWAYNSSQYLHYWIPTIMGCFSSCSLLVKTLASPMHLLGKVSKRVGEACVRRGLKILKCPNDASTRERLWECFCVSLTLYQSLPTAEPARIFQALTAVAWKAWNM